MLIPFKTLKTSFYGNTHFPPPVWVQFFPNLRNTAADSRFSLEKNRNFTINHGNLPPICQKKISFEQCVLFVFGRAITLNMPVYLSKEKSLSLCLYTSLYPSSNAPIETGIFIVDVEKCMGVVVRLYSSPQKINENVATPVTLTL